MIDIVSTFRSYALSQDGSQRPPDEVIPVRVSLLLDAAAEIERLKAALKPFADESLWCGPQHDFVTVKRRDCDAARATLSGDKHE